MTPHQERVLLHLRLDHTRDELVHIAGLVLNLSEIGHSGDLEECYPAVLGVVAHFADQEMRQLAFALLAPAVLTEIV